MATLMERLRRLTTRRSVAVDNSTIQVFISYAHEDEQAIAGVSTDLRREGLDTWFAPSKRQPGDQISRAVRSKELSEPDRDRILSELGHVLPALTAREIKDIRAWLREGQPATLAIASQLFAHRFVGSPSYRRILNSDISSHIQGWVSRGELSEEDAPRPDSLIDCLIKERLIEPFRRQGYINEPNEDFKNFMKASGC